MRYKILIFMLLTGITLNAQVGIHTRYNALRTNIDPTNENFHISFNDNLELGIDYWLRLENYRVEFFPEIFYTQSNISVSENDYSLKHLGISGNTRFYIFDFKGDCGCPTFSKQGNLFTKGFFLSVAPNISLFSRTGTIKTNTTELKTLSPQFGGSIGAGMDIGIIDFITITPYLRYRLLSDRWKGLNKFNDSSQPDERYIWSDLQFGIRLGFRFDYK